MLIAYDLQENHIFILLVRELIKTVGFNLIGWILRQLELCNLLLSTLWDTQQRLIWRYAIIILIRHGDSVSPALVPPEV